ncbi:hypothetical protein A5662_16610 [Mycobacteriaceae bacterium 1482268.1]|nr:hypothetical protein A5662_16610 [Mycobacteriaceae bacterium 1482268.1]
MACPACGNDIRADAKFCDECGVAVSSTAAAEYKQVTVLFVDVVHSMDIAAAVGTERLHELMSELFDRCADVVERYRGTVDKFTGDGLMAIFGAPVALEDHAIRACVASLEMQTRIRELADEVLRRDNIDLKLRIGLNSGEVIAGDVGSRAKSYTTVGGQVGMAQRMESVAPPGGVMLSESTARLVADEAILAERQWVQIKGAADPVAAYLLQSITGKHYDLATPVSAFVGREWELAALKALLDRANVGHGCVVGVVGPPGIGKSRTTAEMVAIAKQREMPVISTYCESHTSDVSFHVAVRLLRSGYGVENLADEPARARLRRQLPDTDPTDLTLLQDELGIRDPADALPDIAPEARRRRITALVNATMLAREESILFVIEDAHWIDPASEGLLASFLGIVSRTRSMAIVTYRPEYAGALTRSPGAQTIALGPLDDSQIGGLIDEVLGVHPSLHGLTRHIAERASGNPFFAEEIIRDLADRGVLQGERGSYSCANKATTVDVPATLQAAIAARIDRMMPGAKRTLNAAAVIGLRFDETLLTTLVDDADLDALVQAELIDQVAFVPRAEFAFRHPLIRAVAYNSQLTSVRRDLHRRLAAALEARDPAMAVERAALIAEHYESAGNLQKAYEWHMRAGDRLIFRGIHASRLSWQRASQVADKFPVQHPGREAMRIAPRTLIVASDFRTKGPVDDEGFEELCRLTGAAGDKLSLAVAMAGRVFALGFRGRYRESSQQADELIGLVESIGDRKWELILLAGTPIAKFMCGDITEGLRLADRLIDMADGDFRKGSFIIESPLSVAVMSRAAGHMCIGAAGWKREMDDAAAACGEFAPFGESVSLTWKYGLCVAMGAARVDASVVGAVADLLARCELRGDDLSLDTARFLYGLCLAQLAGPEREHGLELLVAVKKAVLQENRSVAASLPVIELELAKDAARNGDVDGAIDSLSSMISAEAALPRVGVYGLATEAMVDILLGRGSKVDIAAAEKAVARMSARTGESEIVLNELLLLRLNALVANAHGNRQRCHDYTERYRAMAIECGYEAHIDKAESMQ